MTIHHNDCGNCKHWHPKPPDEQGSGILEGLCDKFESLGIFEDECYDEDDHCFEGRGQDDA